MLSEFIGFLGASIKLQPLMSYLIENLYLSNLVSCCSNVSIIILWVLHVYMWILTWLFITNMLLSSFRFRLLWLSIVCGIWWWAKLCLQVLSVLTFDELLQEHKLMNLHFIIPMTAMLNNFLHIPCIVLISRRYSHVQKHSWTQDSWLNSKFKSTV